VYTVLLFVLVSSILWTVVFGSEELHENLYCLQNFERVINSGQSRGRDY